MRSIGAIKTATWTLWPLVLHGEYVRPEQLRTEGKATMRPVPPLSAVSHNVDYNAISIKTVEQIAMLRIAGQISAGVLEELTPQVQPGVSSRAINDLAHRLIVDKYGAATDRGD